MGFLDRLLGRKKADAEPQSAPEPPAMPGGAGGTESAGGEGEHDHSHEGEHDHEH
jgi:hypothetical protein